MTFNAVPWTSLSMRLTADRTEEVRIARDFNLSCSSGEVGVAAGGLVYDSERGAGGSLRLSASISDFTCVNEVSTREVTYSRLVSLRISSENFSSKRFSLEEEERFIGLIFTSEISGVISIGPHSSKIYNDPMMILEVESIPCAGEFDINNSINCRLSMNNLAAAGQT